MASGVKSVTDSTRNWSNKMIKIKGQTIEMTRGDTLVVAFRLLLNNNTYTPSAGDSLKFMLGYSGLNPKRTAYKNPGVIVSKDVPIDTLILRLDPEDTESLDFGIYVYDLQLTQANGRVDTLIQGKNFILDAEVG